MGESFYEKQANFCIETDGKDTRVILNAVLPEQKALGIYCAEKFLLLIA